MFGECMVVPKWEQVQWTANVCCGDPVAILEVDRHIESYSNMSKVELVACLLRLHWAPKDYPSPCAPGKPLTFERSNLLRSSEYFQCMLQSSEIFKKDVPELLH